MKDNQAIFIVYLAGLAIITLFLPDFVLSPNDHAFAIGGDPFILYYNTMFHSCHGSGIVLEGMNYPWFEIIFMTDAQGALSILMAGLYQLGIPICEHAIGIIHLLIFLSLPLAAIFLFLILRKFSLPMWYAIIIALLICFLSPQLLRIDRHFGLAYLFLLPLSIYWVILWIEEKSSHWKNFGMMAILIFFTFNNPYLGVICCLIIFLSGIMYSLKHYTRLDYSKFFSFLVVSLLPMLVFYITLKLIDPVEDRVEIQWGYFDNVITIPGLLYPVNSLANVIAEIFGDPPSYQLERNTYLGIIPLLILIVTIISGIRAFALGKIKDQPYHALIPIFLGSFILLLFSFGFPFNSTSQTWIEENLSVITMFKASGRFAWPFYYVLGLWASLMLWHLCKKIKSPYFSKIILFTTLLIWGYDSYYYLKQNKPKEWFSNPLSLNEKNKVIGKLGKAKIDPNDYQAIFAVPTMQAWTDKMLTNINFESHFHSLRISAFTGLPIINGMLSRMSIKQTLLATQYVSHPLINRDLNALLPNEKPILVVLGGNNPKMNEGELYIAQNADTLYSESSYSILKMDQSFFEEIPERKFIQSEAAKNLDSLNSKGYWIDGSNSFLHLGFDDSQSEHIFYGEGSKTIPEGYSVLVDYSLEDFKKGESYQFSSWVRVDNYKYGLPFWHIEVKDSIDNIIYTHKEWSRWSKDVYKDWIRVSHSFNLPGESKTIRITAECNQNITIDELLIKPKNSPLLHKNPVDNRFMYNNFPIEIEN